MKTKPEAASSMKQKSGYLNDVSSETSIVYTMATGEHAWIIEPPEGQPAAFVTVLDLTAARLASDPVATTPSSAEEAVVAFGLMDLFEAVRELVMEMFGPTASVAAELAHDPDTNRPSIAFRLTVPRDKRELRTTFIERYSTETVIPGGSPAPALVWSYLAAL